MMGLINETQGKSGEARFGVGYFDLIIIDVSPPLGVIRNTVPFSVTSTACWWVCTATPRETGG
jgi:hypothetical protein